MLDASTAGRRLGTAHDAAGAIRARWVVNAAGLTPTPSTALLRPRPASPSRPRRGELIVFDKLARPLVRHIVLPVPTATHEGRARQPDRLRQRHARADGRGRRRQDRHRVDRAAARRPARAGAAHRAGARSTRRSPPSTSACARRPSTATTDPRRPRASATCCVGGIRSTGLTASMAIAEHVRRRLSRDAGLALVAEATTSRGVAHAEPRRGVPAAVPVAGAHRRRSRLRAHRLPLRARHRAARSSTRARAPVPARDLDGLRRRTRALLGRCQGFYCSADGGALLADASGRSIDAVLAGSTP